MTRNQAAVILEKWRAKLVPEWIVELTDGEPGQDGSNADVRRSAGYHQAQVRIASNFLADGDEAEIESSLVHELLHLALSELDAVYEDLDGLVHRDSYELLLDSYKRGLEHGVERIARTLVYGAANAGPVHFEQKVQP